MTTAPLLPRPLSALSQGCTRLTVAGGDGGGWTYNVVSWSVGGLSGGANETCDGTAGSFTVEVDETDFSIASCDLCPAGKASGSRASECVACDAGTSSEEGSPACSDCDAGKFSFASSHNCLVCAAGKASGSRASECVACEAGKFADSDGSDVCEEYVRHQESPQTMPEETDT